MFQVSTRSLWKKKKKLRRSFPNHLFISGNVKSAFCSSWLTIFDAWELYLFWSLKTTAITSARQFFQAQEVQIIDIEAGRSKRHTPDDGHKHNRKLKDLIAPRVGVLCLCKHHNIIYLHFRKHKELKISTRSVVRSHEESDLQGVTKKLVSV